MKIKSIFRELKHHVPFTVIATIAAVLILIFSHYFLKRTISEEVFHAFHFLHIIASAMVTAGLFYKYKPQFFPALLVGISGAIIIGSASDIIFPYLGWISLGRHIHFHLPLIEETAPVLLSALVGSLAGILAKKTKPPHFAHVFLSVFASLFYLVTFSPAAGIGYFLGAFFVVFIAVIIPCCLSDIIFPFLFLSEKK